MQVAQKFGITVITVAEIFKRHHEKLPQKFGKLDTRIDKKEFETFILSHPTLAEVEEKFKISKAGTYRYMRRLGLSRDLLTKGKATKSLLFIKNHSDEVMMLHNEGLSIRKISKQIGLARQTIAKIIEYNISKSVRHPEEG